MERLSHKPVEYTLLERAVERQFDWKSLYILNNAPKKIAANGPTVVVQPPPVTVVVAPGVKADETKVVAFPELHNQQFPDVSSMQFNSIDEARATGERAVDDALSFLRSVKVRQSNRYDRARVQRAKDDLVKSVDSYLERKEVIRRAQQEGGFEALKQLHRQRFDDSVNPFSEKDRIYHDLFEELGDLKLAAAQRQQVLHEVLGVSAAKNVDLSENFEEMLGRTHVVALSEVAVGLADGGRARDTILEQLGGNPDHCRQLFERYKSARVNRLDRDARKKFMQENPWQYRSKSAENDPLDDNGVRSDQAVFEQLDSVEVLDFSEYADSLILGADNSLMKQTLFLLIDSDNQRRELFRKVVQYGVLKNGWEDLFAELNGALQQKKSKMFREAFRAAGIKTRSERFLKRLQKGTAVSAEELAEILAELNIGQENGNGEEEGALQNMARYLVYALIVAVLVGSLGGGVVLFSAMAPARKTFQDAQTTYADTFNEIGHAARVHKNVNQMAYQTAESAKKLQDSLIRIEEVAKEDSYVSELFKSMLSTSKRGRGMLLASAQFIVDQSALIDIVEDPERFQARKLNDFPSVRALTPKDRRDVELELTRNVLDLRKNGISKPAVDILKFQVSQLRNVFRKDTTVSPEEVLDSENLDALIARKQIAVDTDLPIFGTLRTLELSNAVSVVSKLRDANVRYGTILRAGIPEIAAQIENILRIIDLRLIEEARDLDDQETIRRLREIITDNTLPPLLSKLNITSTPGIRQAADLVMGELKLRANRTRNEARALIQYSGQSLPWPLILDQELRSSSVGFVGPVLDQSWFWMSSVQAIAIDVSAYVLLSTIATFAMFRARRESGADKHSLTASLARHSDRAANIVQGFGAQGFVTTFSLLAGLAPQEISAQMYYFALGERTQATIMFQSFVRTSSVWAAINASSYLLSVGAPTFFSTLALTSKVVGSSVGLTRVALVAQSGLSQFAELGGTGAIVAFLSFAGQTQALIDGALKQVTPKALQPKVSALTNLVYRQAINVVLANEVIRWLPSITGVGGFSSPVNLPSLLATDGFSASFDLLANTPGFFVEGAREFALMIGMQFSDDGLQVSTSPKKVALLAALVTVYWAIVSRQRLRNINVDDVHYEYDDLVKMDPRDPRAGVNALPDRRDYPLGSADFFGLPSLHKSLEPVAQRTRLRTNQVRGLEKFLDDAKRALD